MDFLFYFVDKINLKQFGLFKSNYAKLIIILTCLFFYFFTFDDQENLDNFNNLNYEINLTNLNNETYYALSDAPVDKFVDKSKTPNLSKQIYLSLLIYLIYGMSKISFLYFMDYVTLVVSIFMIWICFKNQKFIKKMQLKLNRTLVNSNYDDKVSVLIAARNEENNIENCVRSLMNQSYLNYEVLVMNDNSTDLTETILEKLKFEYDNKEETKNKLKFYKNTELPSNWYGKSWSIQCLSKIATGSILIITDADTIHNYDSIKFCVHGLNDGVDFLSGFPKQNLNTFGLKVLVPSMYIMSSYIIPLWKIEEDKCLNFSLAIGQVMVVKRKVFDDVDGLKQVSNKICEDLNFARLLKQKNYRTRFIAFEDYVNCNMYNSFIDGFFGMSKNVFSALDYNLSKYIYTTLIFGSIVHPLVSLCLFRSWIQIFLSICSISLFLIGWIKTLELHYINKSIVFLYPLMMISIFSVSAFSTFKTFLTKGHQWKGRLVR